MEIIKILLNFFQFIFTTLGAISVFAFVLWIPVLIVVIVWVLSEKDELKKKARIKKAIWIMAMPFILISTSLVGVVILNVIKSFLSV